MTLKELYNKLADQYGNKSGEMIFTFSDKGSMHSYIDFYEKYFDPLRSNVSLLEIGMMTGGSMHMWQQYFDQYRLVGMDISSAWNTQRDFQASIENDPNISLLFGVNSRDSNIPQQVKDQKFDFVIDDGDHSAMAQMETFENYWPLVEDNGVYFIEDVIGPVQIETLKNFLDEYSQKHSTLLNVVHYQGFKNNRADDQILAISRA
jgi:predicted O-methyltransferase YrrM